MLLIKKMDHAFLKLLMNAGDLNQTFRCILENVNGNIATSKINVVMPIGLL